MYNKYTARAKTGHDWLWPLLVALMVFFYCIHTSAQASRATVRLDGSALFQLGAESRQEARDRADQVESRLIRILDTPGFLPPVVITPDDQSRQLRVGGRPVLVVTEDDARDYQTTVDSLARQWRAAIDSALQGAAKRRLSGWGRFKTETQSSVKNAFSRLLESAITVIPRLLAGLLVLAMFWLLATVVRWLMRILFARFCSDLTVENLLKQVAYYSVWLLGLVVAASAVGYDPQALATGLGLTGVALGFALKDILSNFVSGILILIMRPFEIGDQIVIGETEGSVERINLRATRIRTYDGRAVLVPNGEVFTSRVTNNTESPVRRGVVEVPLGYDSDLKMAISVVRTAMQKTDGVLAEPAGSVRVRELGNDDILLEARFWTDSRRSDFIITASLVRKAIVEALQSASMNLPNPSVRIVQLGSL